MIRPQKKLKMKKNLKGLKVGDKIITKSGLRKVSELAETVV
jgi:preprotein translocase subunit YajC